MFDIFWSFFLALWASSDAGCHLDPHGGLTATTDEGCNLDPHGGCGAGS